RNFRSQVRWQARQTACVARRVPRVEVVSRLLLSLSRSRRRWHDAGAEPRELPGPAGVGHARRLPPDGQGRQTGEGDAVVEDPARRPPDRAATPTSRPEAMAAWL